MTKLKHVDFEMSQWAELAQGPQGWSGYRSTVMALSPVGYYRLGETSGTTAADETGEHDGTWSGTPNLGVAGALTRDADLAADFNEDARVNLPASASVVKGGPWSMVGWCRTTGRGQHLWSEFTGTDPPYVRVLNPGGNDTLRLWINDGSSLVVNQQIAGTINDDVWRHIAVVKSIGQVAAYVDGVEILSVSAADITVSTPTVKIGDRVHDAEPWRGLIDEFALFDHALAAHEVSDLYDRGRGIIHLDG